MDLGRFSSGALRLPFVLRDQKCQQQDDRAMSNYLFIQQTYHPSITEIQPFQLWPNSKGNSIIIYELVDEDTKASKEFPSKSLLLYANYFKQSQITVSMDSSHQRRNCILSISISIRTQRKYLQDQLNFMLTKQTQLLADVQIPTFLRPHIYGLYCKHYSVKTDQIQLPLKAYSTFSSFFTRKIRREVPQQRPSTFASPCDGKLLSFSQVTGDTCQAVKGATYSLSELVLGEAKSLAKEGIQNFLKKNNSNKLYQMVIYLAPGDYHRFHSPTSIQILKKIHTPGLLDTVKESAIAAGKSKYQKNARVTMFAQWKQGLLTMVLVGALNVSRIHCEELLTAKRGQQLGYFNLGSTIVLLVQAKGIKQWKVGQGGRVRMGEELFEYLQ